MTRIFIATNPGFFNKGDAAILQGTIKGLREIDAEIDISLLSVTPGFDSQRCDIRIVCSQNTGNLFTRALKIVLSPAQHILLALLWRTTGLRVDKRIVLKGDVLEEYFKADLIIAGLDDSFTTLYGPRPFMANLYSVLMAKILRKKIVLYGSSIGPFTNRIYDLLGKLIVDSADLVTLREHKSSEYLRKIGVRNPNIHITSDLAFYLGTKPRQDIMELMQKENITKYGGPLIGVSMSRVIANRSFPEIQDKKIKNKQFTKTLSEILDDITKRLNGTIVFIPHSIGPNKENDDMIIQKEIYQLMKFKESVVLIEKEYTPEELRGLIGQMDLLIGARTHAVISAASTHVPFIALEYESFKTNGILGVMLGCEKQIYNIKDFSKDSLDKLINETWDKREEIHKHLEIVSNDITNRTKSNVRYIKELIEQ
ncbi:MAG: polysaccharide pyruvyl transferase family protein [Candidatus Altiarchaeia archaeon]